MNTDFEQRLRQALQSTAQEVAPDPETWRKVQAGIRRRQTSRWLSVGLVSATAVLVVAAVLPGLLRGGGVDLEGGPAAPPGRPSAGSPPVPAGIVTTDGEQISVQLDAPGQAAAVEVPAAPGSSLAVWPGSTPQAFQIVVVDEAACRLRVVGSGVDGVTTPDAVDAEVCGPVAFSPDGRHLAWLEVTGDGPVLRTVGWGPSGAQVETGAAFPLDTGLSDLRLQDWVWTSTAGEEATGYLTIAGTGERYESHRLPVERQGDGALALPDGEALQPVAAGAGSDGAVIVAEASTAGVRYQLRGRIGEQPQPPHLDAGTLELVRSSGDGEAVQPLPAELLPAPDGTGAATASGATLWLEAVGDDVLYGNGRDTFRARYGDGQWTVEALPGTLDADFVAPVPVEAGGQDPQPQQGEQEPAAEGRIVAVQTDGLSVRAASGEIQVSIGMGPVTDVAASPVATPRGVPLVWRLDDHRLQYSTLRAGDELVDGGTLDVEPGIATTAPVWAPDAGHVAWVETGMADGGAFRLHVVEWADGPVSDSDVLLDVDTTADLGELRLTGWRQLDGAAAELLLSGRRDGERPRRQAFTLDIEVTDAGEVRVLGQLAAAAGGEETTILQVDGGVEGAAFPLYALRAAPSGVASLERTAANGASRRLELPADVLGEDAAFAGDPWLEARGDVVVLGDGAGRAWRVAFSADGGWGPLEPLAGEVLRAVVLPPDDSQPSTSS